MEDNHNYSSVFPAIQDAADSFQKLNGPINETTDFCLYNQFLRSAIMEFNVKNNCSYTPRARRDSEFFSQKVIQLSVFLEILR